MVLPFSQSAEKTSSAAESYDYTVSEIDNLLKESDAADRNDRRVRKAYDIVVIEDDPDLRSYLERRLSEYYNVYTADDGREGIAKVEKIYPQMVITDLMMPEADGFDVCRSLRSNIKTSHIPVIMLSGQGKDADNKIKALECGASVFIDKPFDMDYLLGQVANLIKTQNELKQRYSRKYIAEPSKITISSMDEELLRKAMNYIERNIDNNDYDVESFVSDMAHRTYAPLPEVERHYGHVDQGVHHGYTAETRRPAAPGVRPDDLRDLDNDGLRQSEIF